MQIDRNDCLAGLAVMPQRQFTPIGHMSMGNIAKGVRAMNSSLEAVQPETEAVSFYGLNHLVSRLQTLYTPHQKLSDDDVLVVEAYRRELLRQSMRVFTYLMLITTRESRHCHGKLETVEGSDTMKKYYQTLCGLSETQAIERMMTQPPVGVSVAEYVKYLRDAFYKGSWSSGYGGKAWAKVTDCVLAFVTGTASAEIMIDTGYTLAHNNGPIFNKGMQYLHYHGKDLLKILDVQRSGQVPELVLEWSKQYVTSEVKQLTSQFKIRYPDAFGDYVDWVKVKDLGALGKYYSEEGAQIAKHGHVGKVKGQTVTLKGAYQVDSTLSFKLYERQAA